MADNRKRGLSRAMTSSLRGSYPAIMDDEDLFPERMFSNLGPDARTKLKNFLLHNEGIEEYVIDFAERGDAASPERT